MSSVFLNSPSTKITFPYSSTSVHLSRGSSDILADMVLGMLNIAPGSYSSRPGRSSGFKGFPPFFADVPHSLSCQVRVGVESLVFVFVDLLSESTDRAARREVLKRLPLAVLRASRPGSRRSRGSRSSSEASSVAGRIWPQELERRRGLLKPVAALHALKVLAVCGDALLGLKKATSVWERRKRRSVRDGGRIVAALPWKSARHGVDSRWFDMESINAAVFVRCRSLWSDMMGLWVMFER